MSGLTSVIKDTIKRDNRNMLWVYENAQYLTMMGSRAYGTNTDESDFDIYGFTIPPKEYIYPKGYIIGFDTLPSFDQYQKHHVPYQKTDVDIQVFNITKYLTLLMQNNPNIIDSLFVKSTDILKSTEIGGLIRDNRHKMLHKGSYYKFSGYAYSQLKKAKSKNREGKRKEVVEQYGYDIKFASHIVRLLDECEQILRDIDIDLHRVREQVKAVKRGEYTLDEIEMIFKDKEKMLAELYINSSLPDRPDKEFFRCLLYRCLEIWYGSIDKIPGPSNEVVPYAIIGDLYELIRHYE